METKALKKNKMDPITLEPYCMPIVASDNVTYSLLPLQKAMQEDPYHRSPVTREVLRPQGHHVETGQAVPLFLGYGEGRRDVHMSWSVRLPEKPSDALMALLLQMHLSELKGPLTVVAVVIDNELMYPPPPDDMKDIMIAFAHMVFGPSTFRNPSCIAGARLFTTTSMQPIGTLETCFFKYSS